MTIVALSCTLSWTRTVLTLGWTVTDTTPRSAAPPESTGVSHAAPHRTAARVVLIRARIDPPRAGERGSAARLAWPAGGVRQPRSSASPPFGGFALSSVYVPCIRPAAPSRGRTNVPAIAGNIVVREDSATTRAAQDVQKRAGTDASRLVIYNTGAPRFCAGRCVAL